MSGHVIEQGGYVHLCLPAEYESSRKYSTPFGFDPRKVEGELLWPGRISQSQIADFKLRLGPSGYAGQFQQRPTPAGGARFKQEWFRYYAIADDVPSFSLSPRERAGVRGVGEAPPITPHPNPLPGGEGAEGRRPAMYRLLRANGDTHLVAADQCTRFAVMDPAGTEPDQNTRPCYTVIQVWDVTPDQEMLLVHQYRAQVQAPDAAEAAIRIVREFDAEFIGIEKDGIGLGIVQAAKRSGITVKAIKARGSKEARSEIAEIRMAAGLVYFLRGAPFLFELEQELLHFPLGEYSDQVDALSHAAMLVHRRGGPPTADAPVAQISSEPDEPFESAFMD